MADAKIQELHSPYYELNIHIRESAFTFEN